MPVHWTRSSIDTPSYPRSQNAFMAFSRTCWGSNAFFPAIRPSCVPPCEEYTTCWNEKSRMDVRSGRTCRDQRRWNALFAQLCPYEEGEDCCTATEDET